jgi:hypothetical protein
MCQSCDRAAQSRALRARLRAELAALDLAPLRLANAMDTLMASLQRAGEPAAPAERARYSLEPS